jgi:HlyD family secretion protein
VLSVPLAAVTTRTPEGKKDSKPAEGQGNAQAAKPAPKPEDKIVIFVNDNGKAKMVEVKTGLSDYDNIEILTGVNDSTEVVTGPFLVVSKRLKEGDKIRKMEKKEKKKEESSSE